MHDHSYENKFNLHVNEILFSREGMGTNAHVEKEAYGNLEIAYCKLGHMTLSGKVSI